MTLVDQFLRLYEKKDHLINKLPNLSDDEKAYVIDFFSKHANLENKIDWNRKDLTIADFEQVIEVNRTSSGKIKKNGLDAFKEGIDYLQYYFGEEEGVEIFVSLNPKFQVFIQNASYLGVEAEWCIGSNQSKKYWHNYMGEEVGAKDIIFVLIDTRPGFLNKVALHFNTNAKENFWSVGDEFIDLEEAPEREEPLYDFGLKHFNKFTKIAIELKNNFKNKILENSETYIDNIVTSLEQQENIIRFNKLMERVKNFDLNPTPKLLNYLYKYISEQTYLSDLKTFGKKVLQSLDFSKVVFSKNIQFLRIFDNTEDITADFSNLNLLKKPRSGESAFSGAKNLNIKMPKCRISSCNSMFLYTENCTIDMSNVEIKANNCKFMFYNCKNLKVIGLNFISIPTNIEGMFEQLENCYLSFANEESKEVFKKWKETYNKLPFYKDIIKQVEDSIPGL